MAFSISTARDELSGMLHGTSINKVTNLYGVFNRAGRNVLAQIDPEETARIANLTNPIYDQVYDYPSPSDLKGNKVIDIRPQANRTPRDNFTQLTSEQFDLYKVADITVADFFFVQNNAGSKSLRIAKQITPGAIVVNACDSLTADGTWAVSGGGSNLALDTLFYISGGNSLSFDIASSSTSAVLTNTGAVAKDLTNHLNLGAEFVYIYLPSVTGITSFALKWGSSATAYWSNSTTTRADGTSFKAGWNLLRFDWSSATKTGTPTVSSITYVQFTITYSISSNMTGLRVDAITSQLGKIFEIEYYSKYLFSSSAGTFQETVLADTDTVNLDTDSFNIWLYECLDAISQQNQGEEFGVDRNFVHDKLYGDGSDRNMGLYKLYKRSYPSRAIQPQSFYYHIR